MCILVLEVQGELTNLGPKKWSEGGPKRINFFFFVKMKVLLGLKYTLDFTEKQKERMTEDFLYCFFNSKLLSLLTCAYHELP